MENFLGSGFNLKLEKTMKKYFVYIASAVLMMAACAKEEVNTPVETPVVGETELITVELNAATKTSLSGKQTVWSEGDEVSVTVDGKVIGTLALVEGNTFSGEVEAGHEGKALLNYPAGVTAVPTTQVAVAGSFANGAALLKGETTIENLRAGKGAEMSNTTALLQFTVSLSGDVEFITGNGNIKVTNCEAGNTYYACVAPQVEQQLSYKVGSRVGTKERKIVTFEAGKLYKLGTLEYTLDSRNLEFSDASCTVTFGDTFTAPTLNGNYEGVTYGSSNTAVATVDATTGSVTVVGVGETTITASAEATATLSAGSASYTLTVNTPKLYIEDDSDYSKLYLYMFDNEGNNTWPGVEITETETVNGVQYKVYTVPADRVGKEYTYIFNNNKGAQVEESKKIKFDKNNYIRVTKKYTEVVNASNTGKDDPLTLYIRNDKSWTKLNYYMWNTSNTSNPNKTWPGITVDMTKKTKIENNTYVYVELEPHTYNRIIINNGSKQTSDLTIPDANDDIYVSNNEYIWKGANQTL